MVAAEVAVILVVVATAGEARIVLVEPCCKALSFL